MWQGIQVWGDQPNLVIELSEEASGSFYIFDQTGRFINTYKVTGVVNHLDLSGLAKGVYLVRVDVQGTNQKNLRLIIE
ncbi:MAG: T9SS type A sorting domain-containing protein [Crocinitomicaceae bacterium]|nr:T9SS type A sorting domain-containing protein [Crocinitomicaceae bacterium]